MCVCARAQNTRSAHELRVKERICNLWKYRRRLATRSCQCTNRKPHRSETKNYKDNIVATKIKLKSVDFINSHYRSLVFSSEIKLVTLFQYLQTVLSTIEREKLHWTIAKFVCDEKIWKLVMTRKLHSTKRNDEVLFWSASFLSRSTFVVGRPLVSTFFRAFYPNWTFKNGTRLSGASFGKKLMASAFSLFLVLSLSLCFTLK